MSVQREGASHDEGASPDVGGCRIRWNLSRTRSPRRWSLSPTNRQTLSRPCPRRQAPVPIVEELPHRHPTMEPVPDDEACPRRGSLSRRECPDERACPHRRGPVPIVEGPTPSRESVPTVEDLSPSSIDTRRGSLSPTREPVPIVEGVEGACPHRRVSLAPMVEGSTPSRESVPTVEDLSPSSIDTRRGSLSQPSKTRPRRRSPRRRSLSPTVEGACPDRRGSLSRTGETVPIVEGPTPECRGSLSPSSKAPPRRRSLSPSSKTAVFQRSAHQGAGGSGLRGPFRPPRRARKMTPQTKPPMCAK